MAQRNRATPTDPGAEGSQDFYSHKHSIRELAAQQGVAPIAGMEDLRGAFWPADDDTEEFSETIRRWRREE